MGSESEFLHSDCIEKIGLKYFFDYVRRKI